MDDKDRLILRLRNIANKQHDSIFDLRKRIGELSKMTGHADSQLRKMRAGINAAHYVLTMALKSDPENLQVQVAKDMAEQILKGEDLF